MYLSDTMPTLLLVNTINKSYNTLNVSDLGMGIVLQIIHSSKHVQMPYEGT